MTSTRFAPDSIYAEWSTEERAAADRAEDRHNSEVRCQMAEKVGTNYVSVTGDDSLRSLAITYRRQLEDIGSGNLTGGEPRARVVRARLKDVEREQEFRAAMAGSWLAATDGTHSYTAFVARGGLAAVRDYGATPASYRLAALLDWTNWKRGQPHVLDWDVSDAAKTYFDRLTIIAAA